MAVTYTREELIQLIANAKKLGFWNDYNHFTKLLNPLQD